MILAILKPADILSLRLVCMALHRQTSRSFGRLFFTRVATDFSQTSLQRLQDISAVDELRSHVQTLMLRPPNDSRRWYCSFERSQGWDREDLGFLLAHLPAIEMLQKMLVERLVNCRSFRIDGYDRCEEPCKINRLAQSDILYIILSMSSKARLPVKSLQLQTNRRGVVRLDAERLQLLSVQELSSKVRWHQLEDFRLQVSLSSNTYIWATDIISHAPNLRKLSLCFKLDQSEEFVQRLALASDALLRLEYFQLESALTSIDVLLTLLRRCRPSLRQLHFSHFVSLQFGSWRSILQELIADFPLLECFTLRFCEEQRDELSSRWVHFPSLAANPMVPDSENHDVPRSHCRLLQPLGEQVRLFHKTLARQQRVMGFCYEGKNMAKVLEVAERAIVLGW